MDINKMNEEAYQAVKAGLDREVLKRHQLRDYIILSYDHCNQQLYGRGIDEDTNLYIGKMEAYRDIFSKVQGLENDFLTIHKEILGWASMYKKYK